MSETRTASSNEGSYTTVTLTSDEWRRKYGDKAPMDVLTEIIEDALSKMTPAQQRRAAARIAKMPVPFKKKAKRARGK